MPRTTYLAKTFTAGCFICHGGDAAWHSANAQALAARHHDLTGHETWCNIVLQWTYGEHGDGEPTEDKTE